MPVSHSRRSAREGSIYETGDGRLRGAITVINPITGVRSRRVVSGRTRAEIVRKLKALETEASAGNVATETTGAYLNRWLEADKLTVRPSSWRQREQYVRLYMVPAIGSIRLARLSPADVERMTTGMVTVGKSPTTAAGVRVILRRALADAVRDGLIGRNAAALARPPKRSTRSMERGRDYLDAAQLRTLIEACQGDPLGALITVAATTGLRQGELLALRWQDIDLESATLRVRGSLALAWDGSHERAEPKTNQSRRMVNLPAAAAYAFARQQIAQDALRATLGTVWQDVDGLAFTDAVGRPLSGRNVTREFSLLLKSAGLPHIPFHGLRHSTATALLSAGVPLKVIADLLGHTTIAVTANIYASVTPELRRDAADAMDRALGVES